MEWQTNPYSVSLLVTALISTALAAYAWQRRAIPAAIPFCLLMIGVAEWSLGYAIELGESGLPSKLLWAKLEYLGIVLVPVAWFLFALQYTNPASKIRWSQWISLGIIPTLTVLFVATNEVHGLIWNAMQIVMYGNSAMLLFDYGPWFWIHTLYSYVLVISGTVLIIRFYVRSEGLYRKQARAVLIGAFVPWIGNAVYIFGISPFPGLDLTPFCFAITGLFFAWGFLRLQLFDIIPLARDAVLENMREAVIVLDITNRIVDFNPEAQKLLKRKLSQSIGLPIRQVLSDQIEILKRYSDVQEADEVISFGDGSSACYFSLRISPLYNHRERLIGRLIVLQNITDQYRAKIALERSHEDLELRVQERTHELARALGALRASEAELRAVFAAMDDDVILCDRNGEYLEFAPTHPASLVRPADLPFGKTLAEILPAATARVLLEKIRHALDSQQTVNVDYSVNKDGQEAWFAGAISPIGEDRIVLVARNITDRKASEEQLVYKALHDALTGLPNRRLLVDRLERALERTKRNPKTIIGVLFIDLDNFKIINDSLGHTSGDMFLTEIAIRLKVCVRGSDTVARLGGDEFALLLENIRDAGEAIQIAERVLKDLAAPIEIDGQQVFTSASIGIAFASTEHLNPDAVLRDADAAMYRAKAKGKGRHEIFAADMHQYSLALLKIQTDLRLAIEQQQLRVYYQPVVDMVSGEIISVEALLRWEHPERGILMPEQFLSLAEETRLILPIGEWVLRTACSQAKAWHAAGFEQLRVAVNTSAHQFKELQLAKLVPEILIETGLGAEYLELEVTEQNAMSDIDSAIQTLEQLSRMGVQISIDDFGKGYSSLNYLKIFPTNTLKIDRSFVWDILEGQNGASITSAIILMAHTLGLNVIAEGVETRQQLDILAKQKCDQVQGFLISPPIPADSLTGLLWEGNLFKESSESLEYRDSIL